MTTVYFAGVNTREFTAGLFGYPILISFADVMRRPGVMGELLEQLDHYPSAILDSGAFTELSSGGRFKVSIEAYADFALEHRDRFAWIANLDAIPRPGSSTSALIRRSARNQHYLESRGLDPVPVYHQGEPAALLEAMLSDHDRIAIGFRRPIRDARVFLDQVFSRAARHPRARIHGFGMTRYAGAGYGYPFESTDSTTWIAEYRALGSHGTENGAHGQAWTVLGSLAPRARLEIVLASYGPRFGIERETEIAALAA